MKREKKTLNMTSTIALLFTMQSSWLKANNLSVKLGDTNETRVASSASKLKT